MKTFKVSEFEVYQYATGFAMLKVGEQGVTIEYYTNASGKPALVKKLR